MQREVRSAEAVRSRIARLDWQRIEADLAEHGWARTPPLLTARDCRDLVALYARDERFRSTVDMQRHRFGAGQYRYFANPLPPTVRALRVHLYPHLARVANRWRQALGRDGAFPPRLSGFLARCRAAGQIRPTPLLLRYEAGGYNRLHQDRYGDVAFPLQATLLLSRPERDFRGGEFLLLEQRPRTQSRGEAVHLAQGEAIFFPNAERPVAGARGPYRAQTRHGLSTVQAGVRYALGIIFHDAR